MAPAALDLNGQSVTLLTLTGSSSGNVITNTNANTLSVLAIINVGGTANSAFAGTIEDGENMNGAQVRLQLNNTTLVLTGIANSYSGRTDLDAATLQLGDGYSNGLVTGQIYAYDESTVISIVVANSSTTFTGYFSAGDYLAVKKDGLGTLILSMPPDASSWWSMTIDEGTVILGGNDMLATGSSLTVDGGSTLDLGGYNNDNSRSSH